LTFERHVTSSVTWPFVSPYGISYWWSYFNQVSIYNSFRDIQWQMWRNGWHDLKRPLNKGQGHLFGINWFLIYDFL